MLYKGDKINNYTLEKYLGKGSYGEVWLAKKSIELSDEGILVALKFLGYQPRNDKTQADFLNQVKREVGTWIKASGHKNIVSVQDGFAFRDDTFVIVSDFADGGSLGDWLQANGGKSSTLEKTVELMSEILDALTHLHSQNPDKIIHRDLKPDNILFKSGVPCITDFGVSRMSQTITKSMAQVAATSAGTPLYMSPESFNNHPASRSMDIWSAGVILFQMLSGDFPYYADNPISLALEVISGNPPKPLPPDVPLEFRAVVAKALKKDVSQRFQTADEMKASLKEALKIWEYAQNQLKLNNKIPDTTLEIPILDTTLEIPSRRQFFTSLSTAKDWREIEAEKERQRKIEEAKRLQEELQRQQYEKGRSEREKEENERKERNKKQRSKKMRLLLLVIVSVALSPFLISLFWTKSWETNNQTIENQPTNISTNKLANTTSNQPATNISANIVANTVTNTATNTGATASDNPNTFKNSIGMEFVKIPNGSFTMGSPTSEKGRGDDETQHKVTISKAFYMGKYEVTQAQWKALMGNNPSFFKGDNLPVEQVSWEEVQEFIKRLNAKGEGIYRLPSEAEWEYAARSGKDGDVFGIGDGKNLSSKQANFDKFGKPAEGKYLQKTVAVGSFHANKFGLYDMQGNVWEWCQDWYGSYPIGSVTDPTGATSGLERVIRGGGWGSGPESLRSAFRLRLAPADSMLGSGFRLIRAE